MDQRRRGRSEISGFCGEDGCSWQQLLSSCTCSSSVPESSSCSVCAPDESVVVESASPATLSGATSSESVSSPLASSSGSRSNASSHVSSLSLSRFCEGEEQAMGTPAKSMGDGKLMQGRIFWTGTTRKPGHGRQHQRIMRKRDGAHVLFRHARTRAHRNRVSVRETRGAVSNFKKIDRWIDRWCPGVWPVFFRERRIRRCPPLSGAFASRFEAVPPPPPLGACAWPPGSPTTIGSNPAGVLDG